MTVKELIEKLERFPDNCVVLVPNENLYRDPIAQWFVVAEHVARGMNEMDGCVIIDDYVEDD